MPIDFERSRITLPHSGRQTALCHWPGDGPVALLHHATGFCAALWNGVAQELRSSFDVWAMDARGHGDSEQPSNLDEMLWGHLATDLAAVTRHLAETAGVDRLALAIGHSVGGALCLGAASREDLFERTLLIDPVVLPPMSPEASLQRSKEKGLSHRSRKRRHVWASGEEAIDFLSAKELFADWPRSAVELYVSEALRQREDGQVELKCPGEVEGAVFEGGWALDLFAAAPDVAIPARLLWAERGSFPRDLYVKLAARLPRGSVVDIDGGHLVPMEAPKRVVDEVERFV
jgi:pimeloyl-ACP methyl ester carboxylesterase